MLADMHQDLCNPRVKGFEIMFLDRSTDRSSFDELGPGAYNSQNFHRMITTFALGVPATLGRQAIFHPEKNIVRHDMQIADDKILVRSRFDPSNC